MAPNTVPRFTLYPKQLEAAAAAVAAINRSRYFINGSWTGTGKTLVSLEAVRRLGRPFLVVAPKVSRSNWIEKAEDMACTPQLVGVINPERISAPRGCEFYTRDRLWTLPQGTVVVWDEIHHGPSGFENGIMSEALARLKTYPSLALLGMSATIADSPLKLRALGWWAGMHGWNEASFFLWCRKHGCRDAPVSYGRSGCGQTKIKFTTNTADAARIMAEIRQGFGESFLALKPSDIDGFPTETIDVRLIDLGKRERAEIDRAWAEMSERAKSKAGSAMAEVGRERERVEWVMAEAVAELAASLVEDGASVPVFFNFTEPRLRFEAAFEKRAGFRPVSIYGCQREAEREAAKAAFQANDCHCISVMAEAGGFSMDLHDVHHQRPRTSLVLPSWAAATVKQCFGRTRRAEGTHAVQYYVLAAGTVQERVASSLRRKLQNIDDLNDADLVVADPETESPGFQDQEPKQTQQEEKA